MLKDAQNWLFKPFESVYNNQTIKSFGPVESNVGSKFENQVKCLNSKWDPESPIFFVYIISF